VLFADGHVEAVNGTRFSELTNRGLVQLALADNGTRRKVAETPPSASAPVVAANADRALTDAEPMKSAANREESKAADFAAAAPGAGQKLEAASVDQKKLDAPAVTLAVGEIAGSIRGDSQIMTAQNSPAEKAPAKEGSGFALATASTSAASTLKIDGFAPAQNPALDKLAVAAGSNQSANVASQQFALANSASKLQNIFKNAIASTPTAPVLASFEVLQNGGEISVVDEDGSIYNGYLQTGAATTQNAPAVVSRLVTAKAATPSAPSASQSQAMKIAEQAAQNYFFCVAGTNRSLKQNVVFTGNFVAISNLAQTPQQTFSGGFGGGGGGFGGRGGGGQLQQTPANQSQQWLFSNSRIAGTAVINNTNAIEINAMPVTP
jgi:hypothetical protein